MDHEEEVKPAEPVEPVVETQPDPELVETKAKLALSRTAGSPQEHNITGVLDHASFPPKVKGAD